LATATQQKALGAFYTDEPVAQHLVRWAVRNASDTVLDPSSGGGVFLDAAIGRLRALGNKIPVVWGIDLAPGATDPVRVSANNLKVLHRDFFTIRPGEIPDFSAIVGNPPFVRYQTFNGAARDRALDCARDAGVELPRLSSSWAPFLVHATRFLKIGGRLGMVVPAELGHAQYAKGVLAYLLRQFSRVSVVMFRESLFPELSEETYLLQCDGYGTPCKWLSVATSQNILQAEDAADRGLPAEIEAITSGKTRLAHYRVSLRARKLYEGLSEMQGIVRFGEKADIGIGYVTGCNDYFHLTERERKDWRIPKRYLRRVILSLAACDGVVLRDQDWTRLRDLGEKAFLLHVPAEDGHTFTEGIAAYLKHGKHPAVHNRFKCRVRKQWYAVPHVRRGDALLSYMSGQIPRLVENRAGLFSPNTLHVVRFASKASAKSFIAGWHSSLTRLSCEMEGHALGGGMLKLEPTEAGRVTIPLPQAGEAAQLVKQIDQLFRAGDSEKATELIDRQILRKRFALSAAECQLLQSAAEELREWRLHK
jgi:adenine-specific DNA-methyltransferase